MNIWKHFCTITNHKILVMKACFKVGLIRQGLLHDLSKYTPTEFLVGCKYYQGTISPNNAERLDKGYSSAWLHHKGRNKHHIEYWTDFDLPENPPMPYKSAVECVCDKLAATNSTTISKDNLVVIKNNRVIKSVAKGQYFSGNNGNVSFSDSGTNYTVSNTNGAEFTISVRTGFIITTTYYLKQTNDTANSAPLVLLTE